MYPVISTIASFFIFFQIQDPIQSRTVHCILMWMSSLLPSFDLEQFHKPFFFLLWHWHFWRLQASCCVRYFGLGLFNSLFMIQFKLIVLAKNNSEVMLCPRCTTSRGTCCQFISFFADWVKVCVCVCARACVCVCVCVCARSQPTLCDPMDCNLPGSSIHGIFRQEYWSGLPCPPHGSEGSPWDLPDPRIEPASLVSPVLAGVFFTTAPPGKSLG